MHSKLFENITAIQMLIDVLPAAIFVKDAESKFLLMNKACEDQWGMRFSDLHGTDASQCFPPAQMEWFLAKDRAIFAGGRQVDFEETFWNASLNQNRIGHTFKNPIYDGSGRPLYLICITIDITDSQNAKHALAVSEERFRSLVEQAADGIFVSDAQGNYIDVNPVGCAMMGYTRQELLRLNIANIIDTAEVSRIGHEVARFAGGKLAVSEWCFRRKDGSSFIGEVRGRQLSDGRLQGILIDITERKQIEVDLHIAATAFEAHVGIMVTNAKGVIIRINRAFTEQTGYSVEDAVGQTPRLLKSGRHDAAFYDAMWKCIKLTGLWEGEIWDRRKNGEIYPKWMSITAIKDKDGTVTHYVGTQTDITERKASESVIKNLAFYDPLTQLPNRRLLMDRLHQAVASSERSGHEGALLFLDLDNFKVINDTLGHVVGDVLLQQVAQRLTDCVREGDTVARIGGDEFVVMLEDLSQETLEAAAQAEAIGEKILATLNHVYVLGTQECLTTASVGATLFGDQGAGIDELFKQADIAMYQAKKAGRNILRFFDPKMQDAINVRTALEGALRKALELQQFHLHYQIQVDSLHRPLGAEVLLRWQHPEHGFIFPDQFIPLAEETGLIVPIGLWVLHTACDQLKTWQHNPLTRELTLAVNVSAKQFHQADFISQVQRVLLESGAKPSLLKLELTESTVLGNVDDTIAKMQAIKLLGVSFSMDDFGTGYSSLQYLKRLPLDQIKIDRSFVLDITSDPNDAAIVQTIIAMTQALGLNVIAEGVETQEQCDFLDNHDCHAFQGYLFSKPVSIAEFEALLGK